MSHGYFVKRGQGEFHYAWMWLKYIAQNRNQNHIEPPSEFLIVHDAKEIYEKHKDCEEFATFVKWMGHIPV